jgi:PIN domain nuclease of toxin-antitoxin system
MSMTGPLDTVEIVRGRLANGLTIADSDVHKLLAKIDQLQARLRWWDDASREMYTSLNVAEAERDEALRELAITRTDLKSYEASLVEWVDFASGVIQDRTDLRKELEELLGVADRVCVGLARGECEQHMRSRLAPATAKARALLRDMTIGLEET